MKPAIRFAIVLALCVLLSATAFAEAGDFFYSGPLDSITGEPASPSALTSEPERSRLSNSMYYDFSRRVYAYPVESSGYEVYANVADGMIVTESVIISASDTAALEIYRNGEKLEGTELSAISQTGEYIVSAKNGDRAEKLFSFQIVGARAILPGGYSVPDGFYILDATLDGEETFYERTYIGMEEEGLYHIEYVCPENGLHYVLETTVDRTPPRVTLEGRRDEEGRFHSAVDVSGLERSDTASLTRDGVPITFPVDGHIAESGIYTIRVADDAGNAAMEQFAIMVYFDWNSLIFFALLCVSLAGILGYMLYKRKRLKVM